MALRNLDLLEEGLLQHTRELSPLFQAQLQRLNELPIVGDVRGLGLMGSVECVSDRSSDVPVPLDAEIGRRIDSHCQALGLLVRPLGHMCVMSPPLVINETQVVEMVDILYEGVCRASDDLVREGLWKLT